MLVKIAPFVMIIATTWLIVSVIINLMKYRLKRRMVETNLNDQKLINAILESNTDPDDKKRNVLKWIFLGLFGGFGLIVQEFLPYSMDESILPYGVLCIFLSTGLLAYYLIAYYFPKNQGKN
ncbi:hypothetical protein KORDIASMS9_04677 [Kordia sp. SMS9]|uniref:hypothetical protein n=1 Tax=Kordia sp. SMS9 TaxID=2282170 RepID=UPI000E107B38|nr:hypothetical protein [Kordia sp. SMS9]AXG72405.1 hypothetical protein KORDIASMS9_04677 [Kordia sp. SMS9]